MSKGKESKNAETSSEFNKELLDYRAQLVTSLYDQIDQFDKAVMTLSGGALGISFAFIKDIVKPENMTHTGLLLLSWICWGVSILSVMCSFYFSHLAFQKALRQLDEKTIYVEKPGGWQDTVTRWLTAAGGAAFFIGLIIMIIFVHLNLHDATGVNSAKREISEPSSATGTSSKSKQ